MREHFGRELDQIHKELLRMAVLVEENILKSLKALKDQDASLAKEVIAADPRINALELAITDRCVLFLATEQPVAGDLRRIVACLKAVSDVERIGDYAVHAAKNARELSEETYVRPWVELPKMLLLGTRMLKDSVDALVHGNVSLARTTARRDGEMDTLNKQIIQELLSLMLEDKHHIKQATKWITLSRFLERMGDHAVQICAWTLYAATGLHEDL